MWSEMYIGLHVKYPLFLSDFNEPWTSRQILGNTEISNIMKILPVGAELFHEGRQTDRHDEADNRFSQFCESALN